MSQTTWSHQTSLLPYPVSTVRAREFVRHRLTDHDLLDLIDDVEQVASELATNAAIHTRQPFTVTLRREDFQVVLSVTDSSLLVPVQRSARGMDTHGRGLGLVESISHQWGIDRRIGWGKSVWASFEVARK